MAYIVIGIIVFYAMENPKKETLLFAFGVIALIVAGLIFA